MNATIFNKQIETRIVNKGSWMVIQLVQTYSYYWNRTPEVIENDSDEILTMSKYFGTKEEIEAYMKTKLFKSILKAAQNNCK